MWWVGGGGCVVGYVVGGWVGIGVVVDGVVDTAYLNAQNAKLANTS